MKSGVKLMPSVRVPAAMAKLKVAFNQTEVSAEKLLEGEVYYENLGRRSFISGADDKCVFPETL